MDSIPQREDISNDKALRRRRVLSRSYRRVFCSNCWSVFFLSIIIQLINFTFLQLGTLCYCDEFCDQHINPDCCPDYEPVCKGIAPGPIIRPICDAEGVIIQAFEEKKVNCNLW
jgi:Somatomedin B domain